MTTTAYHLTRDPWFTPDPQAVVVGYGVKNAAPCEVMQGVLYASPAPDQWQGVRGAGSWNRRGYVAELELDGQEGVDWHTLSDREILVTNLDAVTVVEVRAA